MIKLPCLQGSNFNRTANRLLRPLGSTIKGKNPLFKSNLFSIIQANWSYQATSLTEENGQIKQVVGKDRLEKYMEKFNRLAFLAALNRKLG